MVLRYRVVLTLLLSMHSAFAQEQPPQEGPMLQVTAAQGKIVVNEKGVTRPIASTAKGARLWALGTQTSWFRVYDAASKQYGWISERDVAAIQYSDEQLKSLTDAQTAFAAGATLINQGQDQQVLAELLKALDLRIKVLGEKDPRVADVLGLTSTIYIGMQENAKAESPALRALAIREIFLGEDHEKSALNTESLAMIYKALHDREKAVAFYQRTLDIRRRLLGPDHPKTLDALSALGKFYSATEAYDRAEPLLKQALDTFAEVHGEYHTETAVHAYELATNYDLKGEYATALPLLERSVRIHEKVSGANHPDTATAMLLLGMHYQSMSELSKAEPLLEGGMKICETLNQKALLAIAANILGQVYQTMGEFGKAEPLLLRALEINNEEFGKSAEETANSLDSLGGLYRDIGDFAKAESNLQRSLSIRSTLRGAEHSDTAQSLNSLGALYEKMGQHSKAEPFYRRSYDICEKNLGLKDPGTAIALMKLATVHREAHDYMQAEELLLRGQDIFRTVWGEQSAEFVQSLIELGKLYTKSGKYTQAESVLKQGLAIQLRLLGEQNPAVAVTCDLLSDMYAAQGNFREAIQSCDRGRRFARRHTVEVLPGLSEKTRQTYLAANFRPAFTRALSLGLQQKDDPRAAAVSADWLLNGKGVAQEVLAEAALLSSTETAPLVYELRQVRDQIARWSIQTSEANEAKRREQLATLETRQQQLQMQIAERGPGLNRSDSWVSTGTVMGKLPFDSVFVNIARFEVAEINSENPQRKPARYVAWIIPAAGAGNISIVDLGEATLIDNSVTLLRQHCLNAIREIAEADESRAEADFVKSAAELSRLIIAPLESSLQNAKEIIFSPDGDLWNVPWSALLTKDGRYIVEDFRTRFVLSGRELVYQLSGHSPVSEPVIFADPNFNLDATELTTGETDQSFRLRSLATAHFPQLNSSAAEAASIRPSVEEYAGKPSRMLLQDAAQEATFKDLHRPQILLLSTHGYFEPKHDNSAAEDSAGYDNPLLRCGLALAGCNNRDRTIVAGNEDGIVTGLEIVGTDLRGTELVVLSACETGLGEIRHGEGVSGLRQAFQLAGARSVVSSLWQVEDGETARLMDLFFKNIAAGMNKSESLRQTQLARIKVRKERFGAAHPFFWAAFTLTGQE